MNSPAAVPAGNTSPPPRSWRDRLAGLVRRRELHAIALLTVLIGLFFVMLLAMRRGEFNGPDLRITRALQQTRSPFLDAFAEALTFIGGFGVIVPLGAVAVVVLLRDARRVAALLCGVSVLGHPLNLLLKLIAQRPRPTTDSVDVLVEASGTSFPSGHAMASLLFYGFLAFLAWVLLLKPGRPRLAAVLFLVSLIILIGISRIYVGNHWLSDVVGGWICGLFFLLLLAEGYRLLAPRTELAPPKKAV